MLERLINFLKESRTEMKKVTWPTRRETINSTLTVIVISAVIALFLGALDFIFQFILNKFVL